MTTAKAIRGNHGKHSAIDPLPLGDGKFIIPENVLSDEDLHEVSGMIPGGNPRKTIEEIKTLYPDFQKDEEGN
jgi:hypothetical protein